MKTERISPKAYVLLQDEYIRATNYGFNPDYAARSACNRIALPLHPGEETVLVVDYSLHGSVWPFQWADMQNA